MRAGSAAERLPALGTAVERIAAMLDPVQLALAVGIIPDPWQERALRSAAPRMLLCCSRQSGKSTVAALIALHTALFLPRRLVLCLSPTLRQSQELFRRAVGYYRLLGRPVGAEAESRLYLELANGSRIISLPGRDDSSVRGYSSAALLIIDEAARVSDELYRAVRPMLAVSGGRLIALSTPYGTRGWWYEAWASHEQWERYHITAHDCPRIPAEFLAEERRILGHRWYAQEYLCEFVEPEGAVFGRQAVEAAISDEVEPWTVVI